MLDVKGCTIELNNKITLPAPVWAAVEENKTNSELPIREAFQKAHNKSSIHAQDGGSLTLQYNQQ